MHSTIRCFIAIEIPDEIQNKLSSVIIKSQLTSSNGFRPVRPGMIHVTLKFLGETTHKQINDLQQGLEHIASISKPLELKIQGIGVFTSWSHPRTIWAGLINSIDLKNLASSVDQMCESLGFSAETRSFSPHLTLARVSERSDLQRTQQSLNLLRQYQESVFGSFHADHITLFKSTLTPGGSLYTPLSTHQFQSKKV